MSNLTRETRKDIHPLLYRLNKNKSSGNLNTHEEAVASSFVKEIKNKESPTPPSDPSPPTTNLDSNGIHKMVKKFINMQAKQVPSVKLQLFKDRLGYYKKQQTAYDKLIKDMDSAYMLPRLRDILNFIVNDKFWAKNIWTFTKLMKTNPDWVKYRMVMLDKIKQKDVRIK